MHGRTHPDRATNKRLKELLHRYFQLELKDVYVTNVFPFVKLGAISASIAMRDLVRAARAFALPQIEIVGPRLARPRSTLWRSPSAVTVQGRWRRRSRRRSRSAEPKCGASRTPGPLGTLARNRAGADQVARD
jgi:hypothetical protein